MLEFVLTQLAFALGASVLLSVDCVRRVRQDRVRLKALEERIEGELSEQMALLKRLEELHNNNVTQMRADVSSLSERLAAAEMRRR